MNRITIAGTLTRPPNLRHTKANIPVANCTVSSVRRWQGDDGKAREETVVIDVAAWSDRALALCKLVKGQAVVIDGRLQNNLWQGTADGLPHSKTHIVIETITAVAPAADAAETTPA